MCIRDSITSARGASQDSFGARGYTFGNENIFKNGSRVNSGIFPEVSGLERVEVLKGSAAILYGNVAPVSYTHLDVYKRQPLHAYLLFCKFLTYLDVLYYYYII